jgi:hypothetical protein
MYVLWPGDNRNLLIGRTITVSKHGLVFKGRELCGLKKSKVKTKTHPTNF